MHDWCKPPKTAVFLIGVIWKKATEEAVNITLSVGTIISKGIGISYLTGFPNQEFWPRFLLLSFLISAGLVLLMIVVSIMTMAKGQVSSMPTL